MITGWLLYCLFLLLIILPLGNFVFSLLNREINFWQELLFSFSLGIFCFIFLYVSLKYLHLSPQLIALPALLITIVKFKRWAVNIKRLRLNPQLLFILIVITVALSVLIYPSGDLTDSGLQLLVGHSHDGIWHIALINEIMKNIPPADPIYAGTTLQNYHFFFDAFVAGISELTTLQPLMIYFKFTAPFIVLLLAANVYSLLSNHVSNKWTAYLGICFIFLSSNLYFLGFLFSKNANLTPSIFWVEEYATRMVNLQLLLSYLVTLTLLNLLQLFSKQKSLWFQIIFSLVAASLIMIKAYAFVLFIGGLMLLSLGKLLQRDYHYFKLTLVSTLFAGAIFFLFNRNFTPLFIWEPFWFIKSMYESPDHLNLVDWELRRQTFLAHHNYLRVGQLYLIGVLVFLLGNFGFKIIGLLSLTLGRFKEDNSLKMLGFACFLGILGPLLFIQKGIAWNTVQFSYYSVFFSGILTVIVLARLTKTRVVNLILIILLFLHLPGVYKISRDYLKASASKANNQQLVAAALYLGQQARGTVLISPNYASDALIPAISNQQSFYADPTMLELQLINYKDRKQLIEGFFADELADVSFLTENGIKYVLAENNLTTNKNLSSLRKIYINPEVSIYTND